MKINCTINRAQKEHKQTHTHPHTHTSKYIEVCTYLCLYPDQTPMGLSVIIFCFGYLFFSSFFFDQQQTIYVGFFHGHVCHSFIFFLNVPNEKKKFRFHQMMKTKLKLPKKIIRNRKPISCSSK